MLWNFRRPAVIWLLTGPLGASTDREITAPLHTLWKRHRERAGEYERGKNCEEWGNESREQGRVKEGEADVICCFLRRSNKARECSFVSRCWVESWYFYRPKDLCAHNNVGTQHSAGVPLWNVPPLHPPSSLLIFSILRTTKLRPLHLPKPRWWASVAMRLHWIRPSKKPQGNAGAHFPSTSLSVHCSFTSRKYVWKHFFFLGNTQSVWWLRRWHLGVRLAPSPHTHLIVQAVKHAYPVTFKSTLPSHLLSSHLTSSTSSFSPLLHNHRLFSSPSPSFAVTERREICPPPNGALKEIKVDLGNAEAGIPAQSQKTAGGEIREQKCFTPQIFSFIGSVCRGLLACTHTHTHTGGHARSTHIKHIDTLKYFKWIHFGPFCLYFIFLVTHK